MNLNLLFTALALLFFSVTTQAYVNKNDADQKYPTQAALEFQLVATPAASSTTATLTATNNPSTSAALVVTAGITNPDVPRNLTVTTGGSTADCAAGNVTVTGTNYFGKSITENLAISDQQNGTTTGNKAFKTVKSISLPAEQTTHGCTFAVGRGVKLGLKRCMDQAGYLAWAAVDGAFEGTRPTVAVDATHIESNTAQTNTAPNGSKDTAFFFVQNFRCLP